MRLLCYESRINLKNLRKGEVEEDAWDRLVVAAQNLSRSAIFIDDNTDITVLGLRSRARRLKQEYDIKLLVIDYLQLMQGQKGLESREREIAHVSRSLKALAKELEIPVIALSQLNRAAKDRRPLMSDLRESGALEQDADVVAILHREQTPQHAGSPQDQGRTELIVAKHRNGETGTVQLQFDPRYTRFSSLSKHE